MFSIGYFKNCFNKNAGSYTRYFEKTDKNACSYIRYLKKTDGGKCSCG